VTTLEVKSGYGLTTDHELRQLELLGASRCSTPMQLVLTFLGAHIVPQDLTGPDRADAYTDLVELEMLPAVAAQGLARFHDVTVEDGLFTRAQALRLIDASHRAGLPVRVHADAWAPSGGWAAAVQGGAISAEHLTYTPDEEIDAVGAADTIAVLLPIAELVYMTDRRANARRFVDAGVPVAIATDHCSSIHATSLLNTMAVAAPWYRLTPAEAVIATTINAAYALGLGDECGSLDVGKRGDLIVLDCPHPDELFLAVSAPLLRTVVIGGAQVSASAAG
jgi:imidazolonepropionase